MFKSDKNKKKQVQNDLDTELESKDKAFVLFYASWCPHSQRFLPIFQEYAKNNPSECISVVIDDKPELCDKYLIDYYPTVILFRKGKVDKRLDATPGMGLSKYQLSELTSTSNSSIFITPVSDPKN
jgi:thioredoxin 1